MEGDGSDCVILNLLWILVLRDLSLVLSVDVDVVDVQQVFEA